MGNKVCCLNKPRRDEDDDDGTVERRSVKQYRHMQKANRDDDDYSNGEDIEN